MLSTITGFFADREWSDPLIAAGTIVLAAVTALLAWYTKRLADVTMRASVVATLEPSKWSSLYFDLHVENEGTAAAFDVHTTFDPPIKVDPDLKPGGFPLGRVSILRSGQRMSSFVTSYKALEDQAFEITVSWSSKPKGGKRESLKYPFDMASFAAISTLGKDPAVQVAEELKKLRELYQGDLRSKK